MKTLTLEFKWGTSRGRDTYGYGICSLYVNGTKLESCNGGNYDMQGTVLGHWIAKAYADRLVKLNIPMSRRNGEPVREYYGLSYYDRKNKTTSSWPTKQHTVPDISWGIGISAVKTIGEAVGLKFRYVPTSRRDLTIYQVDVDEEWVPAPAEKEAPCSAGGQ